MWFIQTETSYSEICTDRMGLLFYYLLWISKNPM